jgi:hypothetical protein
MIHRLVGHAVDVVTHVREARDLHTFEHAVGEFMQLLGRVPDAAAGEISGEEIGVLQTLSEEVIDRIEQRADSAAVRGVHDQALISRLYEIRRLLEEIHHWRQHFAAGRYYDPSQLGSCRD